MTGTVVDDVFASGPAPATTGGSIADGTYLATAVQVYGYDGGTGPTGGTFQETLVVSGSTTQAVQVSNGVCKRTSATIAFGSTTVTSTDTCGPNAGSDAGVGVFGYGVTSTGFFVTQPVGPGETLVLTFTKQ